VSWQTCPLGDLVNIKGGGTPSRAIDAYWSGGIPWATVKDFKGSVILETDESISELGAKKSATNIIPKGTIIIPTRMALGKVAVAGKDVAINQDLKALVLKHDHTITTDFLFWFLRNSEVEFDRAGKGATVKGITVEFLKNVLVPLPPLATQKHIARVLEQADQLRKQAQLMESELNQLAQSLFLEMFGDYRNQPEDRFVPLCTVADVVSGVAKGSDMKGKQTRVVPYIRVANVQDGFLNLSEIKEIEATERDIEKYVLQPGDILMTEGGDFDKLGRGAMWSGEVTECIHQNHIFRVRFSNEYEPKFFEYYLRTSKVKLYFLRCAKQTTNLASINMTQLKALPIPKEGRKKQEQFVAALELIEKQIKTVKTKGEYLEQTFQALMQRAFNGELTAPERKAA
jgi:type I restriction enzyme S subunit